jgi:transposase
VRVADPSGAADSSAAERTDAAATPTARVHAHAPDAPADAAASPSDPRPPTKQERQRQAGRAVRVARYEAVRTLHAQGQSIRAIARQLGIGRNTVKRFLAAAVFPEQATRGATTSILDPYKPYLQQQVAAGVQNARQLWEEIRTQGYAGSALQVRQYVGTLRVGRLGRGSRTPQAPASSETTAPLSAVPPPKWRRLSARRAAWLLLCPETQRTTEQQAQVKQVLQASAPLAAAHPLAQDFGTLIRKRQRDTLDDWLQQALESGIDELISFARGIQQTYAEVAAALELPWSSGQVEGRINRLKTIKRQMYGRAGFALLRAMVLAPG